MPMHAKVKLIMELFYFNIRAKIWRNGYLLEKMVSFSQFAALLFVIGGRKRYLADENIAIVKSM